MSTSNTNEGRFPIQEITTMKGSECIQLLNEIDFLVTNANTIPFSSKVMVDAESLFSLTEKFREAFPSELEKSELVIQRVQTIVDDAEREANNIIAEANLQAHSLLNESRILQEAQARASHLINEAMAGREQMQKEAEDFVYSLFIQAESQLLNNAMAVKQAVSSIKQNP